LKSVLNKKITPYIYTLFFLLTFHGIFAQEFELKLVGKDSVEMTVLNQLNYQKKHKTEKGIYTELNLIDERLKQLGYFTAYRDTLQKLDQEFIATYSLGKKTEQVTVLVSESIQNNYKGYSFALKDSVVLKTQELTSFIQSVLQVFDERGESFSQVQLQNPTPKGDTLFVNLAITSSKKRSVNNIVIKGYEDFPEAFIKKYFKLNEQQTFSKKRLREISILTKSLDFVEEIKPPEVLFKQDSTILYLFLKRLKTSSVDGIINFASKDDGSGLLINGNLDLKLNNVLNTGESFQLYWNRVKEGNSEFRIGTSVPYIFSSSFSTDINFNIYRQDSTFLNTTLQAKLNYQLNPKSTILASYSRETSDYLLDDNTTDFDSYSNRFFGVGYRFRKTSESPLFNTSFTMEVLPQYGTRQNSDFESDQWKLAFFAETNITLTPRSYLNTKNSTGILESDNFLTNELFRIGGANSVRGFNEQSIFTPRYSYVNIEYRYVTSLRSYLHTITDFGFYRNIARNSDETLLGLGLGYLFNIDNNQVNLGYALGVTQDSNFDLNNSKLIIRWISTF
jgi:hypothetical protein